MSTNYSQSNNDNDTCQHDLLHDKQQFGIYNKQNKNNINDYHSKILSNPIISSLGHNLQRIHMTTATTLSTSGCTMEYARINTTHDIVPFEIQHNKNKSLNAAMVAHLHQLEVRNQRLEKEKISLEHQLAHILKRLTTDQTINKNEYLNNENRGEEQQRNQSLSSVNQNEQSLVEEKGYNNRYDEKLLLKHAPIACYDDLTDRSLLESLSGFSLGEYSSLSDAYDDICLNKNLVNDVNDSDLSELFYTEQKTLTHDNKCIANQIITEQSTHRKHSVMNQNEADNQQSFMKFGKEIKQSKECSSLSPEELMIYRPDERVHYDDNDNNSESYYNTSSSSISPSPKSGIQRRTLSSRMKRVIVTRNERLSSSLSVESYNSSSDSMIINNNRMHDNEQVINLNYYNNMHNQSTSLPVSPVTSKNWMSKSDFLKSVKDYTTASKLSSKINRILDSTIISTLYPGGICKSIHQQNNSNKRGSDISEASNPTTFNSNTPQSQNKNSMISVNKNNLINGPPKIHISRKHLYEPKECIRFSDTSSSINQIEKIEDNLLKSLSHTKNIETTSLNDNQSIKYSVIPHLEKSIQQNVQLTKHNIFSNMDQSIYNVPVNSLSCKQMMMIESSSLSSENQLPYTQLTIGSINDFLNTNLETSFCIDLNYLLADEKNQLALKYLSKCIKSIEVFTCISGVAYLLQNIKLNLIHLMPILIKQINESITINYDQSSETNSEPSIHQTIDLNQCLTINLNKPIDSLSIKSIKQFENLSNDLYNLKSNTFESYQTNLLKQSNLFDNLPILNDENKLSICENYSGVLLKLNNHLKIWHHYWCILTSKGLFLHQCQPIITLNQSTTINQPKKVILYTDIHNVRRPTNMSTSINQLMCSSLPKNDSLLLLSSESATTATASTTRNNIETRPNVSAPVSRKFTHIESMPKIRVEKYFELILHNKKVYRLRGVTSQETTKWLSLIKNMLRINEAEQILNKYKSQIIKEVTQRTNKPCNISTDFHDSGQLLTSSSDSDSLLISLNCSKLNQERQQTIKIWTPEHEPIYLLCPTVEECEQWRDSLIRATLHSPTIIDSSDIQKSPLSSSTLPSIKLFENIREIWKQLVNSSHINNLYHSIISIKEPISKTISIEYTEISLRLFNHLLFLCHPQIDLIDNSNLHSIEIPLNCLINSSQWLTLKYLIMKQIVYFCLKYPILKDELYLQLIKQIIFAGIHTKQIPKDAYIVLFKNKIIKRTFAILTCTKSQELTDESNLITSHLKYCNNFKQNEGSTFHLQIGNRYKQSLPEVISQLTSSPIAKLIIPLTNLNHNRKPEHWWPSIAIWECLCLFLTFMLPSDPVVECLQQVFKLYMDPIRLMSSTRLSNEIDPYEKGKSEGVQLKTRYFTEIAGYAAFCHDTLNRTKLYGGRDQYPSVLEVFTISIRNPYMHVYPFSLPIYLPFGSDYEVVNFHGSSTIQDLQMQIIEKLGFHEISCKHTILFGIYLCLGESVIESKHIYLNPQWKICDIISIHEQFTLEHLLTNNQSKQEQEQQINSIRIDQITIKLLFKVQTFTWKILRHLILNKSNIFLLNFIVHQLHANILANNYQIPIRGIDFIDLIVYLCRADYYDYSELQKHRWTKLTKCSFNTKFHFNKCNINTNNKNDDNNHKQDHENQIDLATFYACFNYLKHLKRLYPYRFSCSAYIARVNNLISIHDNQLIWIVPQEDKINLLTCGTFQLTNLEILNQINLLGSNQIYCLKSILYKNIIAYGSQKNGIFFLVYMEYTNPSQQYGTTSKHMINHDVLSKQYINQIKDTNYYPFTSLSSSSSSNFVNSNQRNITQHQPYYYYNNKEWKLLNTHQSITVKKLRFFLTDLHAVMDLTNVLTFLINIQKKSEII
ncbi:unnamed protein product [Schistosoma mattheei]|uniref:Uncharacterized protein n=1 Tax=Schistosoma mattheei TaxID=31246 RepID=A0A183PIP7_9TREM|nr:unnamed protein product [Schistosoma mattheei]